MLHQGIAERTGLSFGLVVVLVGLAVLLLWIPLRQRPGVGTVDQHVDGRLHHQRGARPLPHTDALVWRWLLLLGGLFVTALGVGLYIGCGLGPGPATGS